MFKIEFTVPVTHVEMVKNAMFAAGAGKFEHYACCAWQVLGIGQFKPLSGSKPYVGARDKVEYVAEYKVEMICAQANIIAAIAALKLAHPYEVPAYQVIALENL